MKAKERRQHDNRWPGYVSCLAYIVRAEDEPQARQMAAEDREGMETKENWLLPKWTTCVELTNEGNAEVILSHCQDG